MKASWGERSGLVTSRDELEAVQREIDASGQPTMVFLTARDGRCLVVGLGAAESVLTYVDADARSFHSLGAIGHKGHLVFLNRDQLDEFMAEMAIPTTVAFDAAVEFLETGERPSSVRWEADWGE
ncbi:MAG: Imm1 family immunity protein [Acidobacteriota bacterium]